MADYIEDAAGCTSFPVARSQQPRSVSTTSRLVRLAASEHFIGHPQSYLRRRSLDPCRLRLRDAGRRAVVDGDEPVGHYGPQFCVIPSLPIAVGSIAGF